MALLVKAVSSCLFQVTHLAVFQDPGFTTEARLSQLKEVGVEEQLQSYHSGFHLGTLRAWKEQDLHTGRILNPQRVGLPSLSTYPLWSVETSRF